MGQFENLFDMAGMVALVTGGSRGLGKEIVSGFAMAGADVIIASRRLDSCEALAREVRDLTGRRTMGIACNVGDWEQCNQLADTAYREFGKVDVLVNNAGMSPIYNSVDTVTEQLFDKVINVNLKGSYRLSALIGARMVQDGGGSIIMISSNGANHPRADIVPYAAAKAGVNAMTMGFAHAFAPTVRVNCIMPGPFLTDISKAWDMEKFARRAKDAILLRRGGEADEIVGAALYFATRASSYTTGAVLPVTGGTLM